jgi:hypothetical protein
MHEVILDVTGVMTKVSAETCGMNRASRDPLPKKFAVGHDLQVVHHGLGPARIQLVDSAQAQVEFAEAPCPALCMTRNRLGTKRAGD